MTKLTQQFVLINGQMHNQLVCKRTGRVKQDIKVDTTIGNFKKQCIHAATIAKADQGKVKNIIIATRSAHAVAKPRKGHKHGGANSLRHAYTRKHGFQRIDPIAALSNAIDKFSRLNPAVLKGGQALKDHLIARAWIAYAALEVDGLDNAHFTETQLPTDDRRHAGRMDDKHGFNDPCYKQSEV